MARHGFAVLMAVFGSALALSSGLTFAIPWGETPGHPMTSSSNSGARSQSPADHRAIPVLSSSARVRSADSPVGLPPLVSSDLTLTGNDAQVVVLSWTPYAAFLGRTFLSYQVEASLDASGTGAVTFANLTNASTTSFAVDWASVLSALGPGASYWQVETWVFVSLQGDQVYSDSNVLELSPAAAPELYFGWWWDDNDAFAQGYDTAVYGAGLVFESAELLDLGTDAVIGRSTTGSSWGWNVSSLRTDTSYSLLLLVAAGLETNGSTVTLASQVLQVTAPPALAATLTALRTRADVGQAVSFLCSASGGVPPYHFDWIPFIEGATDEVNMSFNYTGEAQMECRAFDDSFYSHLDRFAYVNISPDPTVGRPLSDRTSADVGQLLAFSALTTNGSGNLTFAWALPTGCHGSSDPVACEPTGPGNFSVSVAATDSNGFTVNSTALAFTVYADPTVILSAGAGSIPIGANVTLLAQTVGGSGGFSYTWLGLPPGCISQNLSQLACTPSEAGTYRVSVKVVDSNGVAGTSPPFTLKVASHSTGPTLSLLEEVTALTGVGATVVAAVALTLRRRRRRGSAAPPAPSSPSSDSFPPRGSPPS